MRINLEFNSLAELDEFIAHHGKSKTTVAAPAKPTDTPKEIKSDASKDSKPADKPKEPAKAADAPKNETESELEFAKDVAPRILKLAEKKGRDVAVKLLESFGVTKGPQLEPAQYAKFVKAADAKLAEED